MFSCLPFYRLIGEDVQVQCMDVKYFWLSVIYDLVIMNNWGGIHYCRLHNLVMRLKSCIFLLFYLSYGWRGTLYWGNVLLQYRDDYMYIGGAQVFQKVVRNRLSDVLMCVKRYVTSKCMCVHFFSKILQDMFKQNLFRWNNCIPLSFKEDIFRVHFPLLWRWLAEVAPQVDSVSVHGCLHV